MSAKRKAKRRGLGALGQSALAAHSAPLKPTALLQAHPQVVYLAPGTIAPSKHQPRTHMDDDALDALAASIREQGVIQPLVVRPADKRGVHELIAGERRLRAAERIGLEQVPAIVREVDERTAAVLALVENLQREDLGPMEEAQAFRQLMHKFDLTHAEIADLVGRSRPAVSNALRLLNLAPEVRELLESRQLEMGHARALLTLDRDKQPNAAAAVVAGNMTVRETEQFVARGAGGDKNPGKDKKRDKPKTPPDIVRLQDDLSTRLGTPVRIEHKKRGGRVIIRYANLDVLDGVLGKIR